MSFPHDNNLVPWHQTNLKPLLSGGWLGKKQESCKAILRDAVSFCLQDVLVLRILFANFLLCLLFFVFSVLLLDDILFFLMARSKSP